MKLSKLSCPDCQNVINMDIKSKKSIFCPFCGNQIMIDDEVVKKVKYKSYDKNIKINEKITNEDALLKAYYKYKKYEKKSDNDASFMKLIHMYIILIGFMIGLLFLKDCVYEPIMEHIKISSGMVKIGYSYSDMIGKNYEAVIAMLKEGGFDDISTVDLNDADWFFEREDTVESVVIDGKRNFKSDEFFHPSSRVIISHH